MSTPMSLFQRLLNLVETSAEAAGLYFVVATDEGLRALKLEEILKSVPAPTSTVITHEVVREPEPENPLLQQLVQQLSEHKEQLDLLSDEISDVQSDLLKRLKKASKEPFVPDESVSLGLDALRDGAVDAENVAVGLCAGAELDGQGNTLIGPHAGTECKGVLRDVTAVGYSALAEAQDDLTNVTALGAYSDATGDNQVILGNAHTTTYSHSAPHRRADVRDMHEPEVNSLGLDFVLGIRPLQYRNDFRELYIDWENKPVEPEVLRPEPQAPTLESDDPAYQPLLIAYRSDKAQWDREHRDYVLAVQQFHVDLTQWLEDNKLSRIKPTGEHVGTRTHVGFNGAELLELCERFGVNMAFVQDHKVNGGKDVLSLSDGEMVGVLWTAIHDLYRKMTSSEFIDEIASALYQRHKTITEATQAQTPVGSDLPAQD
ncbi:tail fiber domain-containing protein [Xanthomonas phage RTH11]|nr:tail fiber domain-containing protein [Xanthomonas phage RTH11]